MPRVLFIARSLNRSGESRHLKYVTNILKERGYYVKILAYFIQDLFYNFNSDIEILNSKNINKMIHILNKLYSIISRNLKINIENNIVDFIVGKLSKMQQNVFESLINNIPVDFDHYIVLNPDLAVPLHIAKVDGKKYYSIQGFVYGEYSKYIPRKEKYYLDIYEYSLKLPFYFLLSSSFIREEIMKYNKGFKYKIVGNGVDTTIFYPRKSSSEKSDAYKILVILRKSELKGDTVALKVLKEVSKKIKIKAILIGYDKKYHGKLDFDYVSLPYLHDEELAKTYSSADVYLFTSYVEGFGLPPLEAMACGTPVVTTNAKGNMEYTRHEYNALVSEPGDVEGLTKNVIRILTDDKLKERLVENGLKTAKSWTWDKVTDKYEQAFRENSET